MFCTAFVHVSMWAVDFAVRLWDKDKPQPSRGTSNGTSFRCGWVDPAAVSAEEGPCRRSPRVAGIGSNSAGWRTDGVGFLWWSGICAGSARRISVYRPHTALRRDLGRCRAGRGVYRRQAGSDSRAFSRYRCSWHRPGARRRRSKRRFSMGTALSQRPFGSCAALATEITTQEERNLPCGRRPTRLPYAALERLSFISTAPWPESCFARHLCTRSKCAYVTLYTADGHFKTQTWNATNFTAASRLRNNLRSGYLRNAQARGITKAVFSIIKPAAAISYI